MNDDTRLKVVTLALLAAALVACSDEPVAPSPRGPATLTLGADTLDLSVGESVVVTATAFGAKGGTFTKPTFRWESANPAIATVDSAGRITAHAEGSVVIRATSVPGKGIDSIVLAVRKSFVAVAAGSRFSCGLTPEGRLWCWGDNRGGALGIGRAAGPGSPVPVAVAGDRTWRGTRAQHLHICGVTTTNEGFCWGSSEPGPFGFDDVFGGVGDPTDTPFRRVVGGHEWRSIAAGTNTSCGVTVSGDARCWGRSTFGALGAGLGIGSGGSPRLVVGGLRYREVGSGGFTGCGLTHGGSLYCWGLGYGFSPVLVPGGHVFVQLAVGRDLVCALTGRGDTWCWGVSNGRLLGRGGPDSTFRPLEMARMPPFSAIAASTTHVCGLEQRTGRAFCWGSNRSGELGRPDDGTGIGYDALPVVGDHSFVQIAVGNGHTCGVTAGGGAWCWGAGAEGQLGDGSLSSSSVPRRVRRPR